MRDKVGGAVHDKYAKLIAFAGAGKRVLDVGCADGYLAGELMRRGNEVLGVEIDPLRAERARREQGVHVVVGDICCDQCWEQIEGDFDVVVFSDVLEHVLHPQRVLARTRQVLRPHGCVLVSLPNIAYFRVRLHLLAGRFDYTHEGILDKTHVHFYTLRTARELIESCGYAIVDFTVPSEPKNILRRWLLQRLIPRLSNFFAVGFIFKAMPNEQSTEGGHP